MAIIIHAISFKPALHLFLQCNSSSKINSTLFPKAIFFKIYFYTFPEIVTDTLQYSSSDNAF